MPLLQTMVRARSDPTSGQYAQWMTRDAVLDVIAPSLTAQDSVITWLKSAGSQNVDNRRDSVFFTASPEGIVQLFGASVCPLLKPPSSAGATSNQEPSSFAGLSIPHESHFTERGAVDAAQTIRLVNEHKASGAACIYLKHCVWPSTS